MVYSRCEVTDITKDAIKNTQEYQEVIDKIIERAKQGYNYVVLNSAFIDTLTSDFGMIIKYLEAQGYNVQLMSNFEDWKISWDLRYE